MSYWPSLPWHLSRPAPRCHETKTRPPRASGRPRGTTARTPNYTRTSQRGCALAGWPGRPPQPRPRLGARARAYTVRRGPRPSPARTAAPGTRARAYTVRRGPRPSPARAAAPGAASGRQPYAHTRPRARTCTGSRPHSRRSSRRTPGSSRGHSSPPKSSPRRRVEDWKPRNKKPGISVPLIPLGCWNEVERKRP